MILLYILLSTYFVTFFWLILLSCILFLKYFVKILWMSLLIVYRVFLANFFCVYSKLFVLKFKFIVIIKYVFKGVVSRKCLNLKFISVIFLLDIVIKCNHSNFFICLLMSYIVTSQFWRGRKTGKHLKRTWCTTSGTNTWHVCTLYCPSACRTSLTIQNLRLLLCWKESPICFQRKHLLTVHQTLDR